MSLAQEDKKG